MSSIVESRPRGTYIPADCPSCKSQQEYMVPPTFIGTLRVRCAACKQMFTHPQPKPSNARSSATGSSGSSAPAKSRRIGSDKNPLDMAYYNILALDSQCTTEEVKKAYRRLAIKLHPDKNRDDPDAEEKFKEISIAYQVLSDAELRHKYNEFGQKNGGGMSEPEGGFHDPEEVFGKMFGGDRFEVLIGNISIGKDMKQAFQQQEGEDAGDYIMGPNGKPIMTPEGLQKKALRDREAAEEKAKQRKARVDKLAVNLVNKLNIFTEAAKSADDKLVGSSFKEICRLEGEDLKDENYGVELLHAIGKQYQAKSAQHLASSQFAPLGWFHGAKSSIGVVSDTFATIKSAMELKAVFERLQAAEQSGIAPEELRKLEEQASEQGLRTMWKGVKLEVESVIRETCDAVLTDPNVSKEKLHLRAVALGMMGEAFDIVGKPQEDFVKIETAASKQRESAARPPPPVPPRPQTASTERKEGDASDKDETLKAAYQAYEARRKDANK
ncbi:hypothetical protein B9479_004055 [Cryptococcus floricola]|uniref:J domain-containing protein n=1 Tax=Cryptococcus floricola TaxID=2591691 RepID=A0A5D3AV25_9TREE|nr:hypothetical protein B9479_004055 [Cryptococcus floricola]